MFSCLFLFGLLGSLGVIMEINLNIKFKSSRRITNFITFLLSQSDLIFILSLDSSSQIFRLTCVDDLHLHLFFPFLSTMAFQDAQHRCCVSSEQIPPK